MTAMRPKPEPGIPDPAERAEMDRRLDEEAKRRQLMLSGVLLAVLFLALLVALFA